MAEERSKKKKKKKSSSLLLFVIDIPFVCVFYPKSLTRWKDLWLAAGIIHLLGVVLYDALASGRIQPWDPTQARQAAFLVNEQVDEEGQGQGPGGGRGERDPLLAGPRAGEREAWERSLEDSLTLG